MIEDSVSRETAERLHCFKALVIEENQRQNLISATTLAEFESRHIADSFQLITLASANGRWCDIGSGAGLPGLVIAIVGDVTITLIEPRRLRADFLRRATLELGLANVTVVEAKAERFAGEFDVITARAVAGLAHLFSMSAHLAHSKTRWILPKGRGAKKELDEALQAWQGDFKLVPSLTSGDAMIVVADRVRRRGET